MAGSPQQTQPSQILTIMEAMRPTAKRPTLTRIREIEPEATNPGLLAKQGPGGLSRWEIADAPLPGPSKTAQPPEVPPWFTAFDLAANTRFTRTPDHVRRRPAGEGGEITLAASSNGRVVTESTSPHDQVASPPDDIVDGVPPRRGTRRAFVAPEPREDRRDSDEVFRDEIILADADEGSSDGTEAESSIEQRDEEDDDVARFVASLSGPPCLPFLGYGAITITAHLTWRSTRRRHRSQPLPSGPDTAALPPPAPAGRNTALAAPEPAPCRREPEGYCLPPLDLLAEATVGEPTYEASAEYLDRSSVTLQQTLHDFGVRGEVIDANPGPVVTLYEFEPAPGTKASRVIGLSNDVARSMFAVSARIAVVPGRNVIGIELPNQTRETVFLRELLETADFSHSQHRLAVALGKTIGGEPIIADLARMPHLLVAGTTGSGKSVAINTMILSLLYMHRPEQCRLIMVDPKMLELSVYEGIPHLLTPVVTDPKKAVVALKWAVREMEERYKKMSKLSVRNIDGFNARVAEAQERGEVITRTVQTGFDRQTGEAIYEDEIMDLEPLPYIVVIVDEMADLMLVAGKDIEGAIQRLAQMARAAGIHLIMATQRPSVDVITGTIKANFPTRISFQVTSKIDSRTILGEMGAEQLLGQGDMLYMAGGGRITRVHGPFVSDGEVEKVVAHLKAQGRPQYLDAVTRDEEDLGGADDGGAVFDKGAIASFGDESQDPYDQAIAVVMRDRKASTSYIQRRLGIGYNRAASIMERMEKEGIVGPANHAGKREILLDGGAARDDE